MVEKQACHDLQWIQEAPALHALVFKHVSARLEQLYRQEDRIWLKKEASKSALAIITKLNHCLETASLSSYHDLHQELLALLKELKLDQLLNEKMIEGFGLECLFMEQDPNRQ